ncbi:5-deoxy-glucuronate isomerase [Bacillus solitudinis]|uniref:5-deoxy-glucuronate isomerase n=1 Tax=Bacillus solitudinis TaxID=2014074 RepID=UPI000C238BC2|nr:5-deoxy-glucuronate isomerase [Bacillus solitudinis]
MSELLLKPQSKEIDQGITILHDVSGESSLLKYVGFKLLEITPGTKYKEELGKLECCVVVLTGKVHISDGEVTFNNLGTRESVFEKIPTDSVYISIDSKFEVEAVTKTRVALCYSPSEKKLPTKLINASLNGVEHRGTGNNQRTVHNILPDTNQTANSLLVVEVYTDSGNWSSYPPHKHDQDNLPEESLLEETYYHEVNPSQGFVFQRVYTDDRSLDETMTVENNDMVMVPKGYHPVGVPAGYTSYYLNVMAGPTRIWKFHNDPKHEWILKQ